MDEGFAPCASSVLTMSALCLRLFAVRVKARADCGPTSSFGPASPLSSTFRTSSTLSLAMAKSRVGRGVAIAWTGS